MSKKLQRALGQWWLVSTRLTRIVLVSSYRTVWAAECLLTGPSARQTLHISWYRQGLHCIQTVISITWRKWWFSVPTTARVIHSLNCNIYRCCSFLSSEKLGSAHRTGSEALLLSYCGYSWGSGVWEGVAVCHPSLWRLLIGSTGSALYKSLLAEGLKPEIAWDCT